MQSPLPESEPESDDGHEGSGMIPGYRPEYPLPSLDDDYDDDDAGFTTLPGEFEQTMDEARQVPLPADEPTDDLANEPATKEHEERHIPGDRPEYPLPTLDDDQEDPTTPEEATKELADTIPTSPLTEEPVTERDEASTPIPGDRPEFPLPTPDNAHGFSRSPSGINRPRTPSDLSFEDSRALLTRLTGLQPWLLEAFPEDLPPLPLSRASSPLRSPEVTRQRPQSQPPPERRMSSTAIPIRFRKPPGSPILRSKSTEPEPLSSPLAGGSPLRNRHSKAEFRKSREFRPLYLVERNRKSDAELDELLPALPASGSPSRISSETDTEAEYESAFESPHMTASVMSDDPFFDPLSRASMVASPQPERALTYHESSTPKVEDADESGQATPKASFLREGPSGTFVESGGPPHDVLSAALEQAQLKGRDEQFEETDNLRFSSPPIASPLAPSAPLDDSKMDISAARSGNATPSNSSSRLQEAAFGMAIGGVAAAALLHHRSSSPARRTLDSSREIAAEELPSQKEHDSTMALGESFEDSVYDTKALEEEELPTETDEALFDAPKGKGKGKAKKKKRSKKTALVEEEAEDATPAISTDEPQYKREPFIPTFNDNEDDWLKNRSGSIITDDATLVGEPTAGPSDSKELQREKILDSTAPRYDDNVEIRRVAYSPEHHDRKPFPTEKSDVLDELNDFWTGAIPKAESEYTAKPIAPKGFADEHYEDVSSSREQEPEPEPEPLVAAHAIPKSKKAKKNKKGKRGQQRELEPSELPDEPIVQEDEILPQQESERDVMERDILEPVFAAPVEEDEPRPIVENEQIDDVEREEVVPVTEDEQAIFMEEELPQEPVSEPLSPVAVDEAKEISPEESQQEAIEREILEPAFEDIYEEKESEMVDLSAVDDEVLTEKEIESEQTPVTEDEPERSMDVEEETIIIPESEVEAEPEVEVSPEAEVEREVEVAPEEEIELQPEAEVEPEPEVESELEPEPEVEPEPEPEPEPVKSGWGSSLWGAIGWGKKKTPAPAPVPPKPAAKEVAKKVPEPVKVVEPEPEPVVEPEPEPEVSIEEPVEEEEVVEEAVEEPVVEDEIVEQAVEEPALPTEFTAEEVALETEDAEFQPQPQEDIEAEESTFSAPRDLEIKHADTTELSPAFVTPHSASAFFTDNGKPSFTFPSFETAPSHDHAEVSRELVAEQNDSVQQTSPAFVTPQYAYFHDSGKPSFNYPSLPSATSHDEVEVRNLQAEQDNSVQSVSPAFVTPQSAYFHDGGKPSFTYPSFPSASNYKDVEVSRDILEAEQDDSAALATPTFLPPHSASAYFHDSGKPSFVFPETRAVSSQDEVEPSRDIVEPEHDDKATFITPTFTPPSSAYFHDGGKPSFVFPVTRAAPFNDKVEVSRDVEVEQEAELATPTFTTPQSAYFHDSGKPSFVFPETRASPSHDEEVVTRNVEVERDESTEPSPAFVTPHSAFFTDGGKPHFTFPFPYTSAQSQDDKEVSREVPPRHRGGARCYSRKRGTGYSNVYDTSLWFLHRRRKASLYFSISLHFCTESGRQRDRSRSRGSYRGRCSQRR